MRLPFAIKVVGFADEEGVRFQAAYLGSKSLAGTFARADLQRKDAVGVSLSEAIRSFGGDPKRVVARRRRPGQLVGYLEVHIEQGPILEQQKLALGVVTAIAGQSRATVAFKGSAGHAGTTPMNLRHDALCAAAEFTLAVEALACRKKRLVATVGETTVLPGASNVIPGEVRLSLDVRHPNDAARQQSATELRRRARGIAAARHVKLHWQSVQETPAVQCDKRLTALLSEAVKRRQRRTVHLHSGAGHDAAVMAAITPVAMLFVRCKGGISHHPDESASAKDIEMALKVLEEFVRSYEPM
jgi:allantoate deiminase